MKKYLIIFILLLPISFFIFDALYSSLLTLKPSNVVDTKKYEVINIEDDAMLASKLLTECFEKYDYNLEIDCDKKIKEVAEIKDIEKKEKNNFLQNLIYLLMILALNTQLSIFIYTCFHKGKIGVVYFHLSDWAINSPPMLGVLGTIIAFALLVGNMENGNIQDVFTKSFFDAAITTIIGGLIYVFNLLLKVKIYTRVK
jgi:hypothetical protein